MTNIRAPVPGVSAPALLTDKHDLTQFDSGVATLNDWLRKRALHNHLNGGSRTHVVCSENRVVGYYCLAAGAVLHVDTTGKVRRNMPDPVPVMVLGRLAVDRDWAGHGLGSGLLRDAVLRTVQVAEIVGVRALLIHAKDGRARQFYQHHGFSQSPTDDLMLMPTLQDIRNALL